MVPPPTPHSLLSPPLPLLPTHTHIGAEVDRIKKNYLESQSRRTSQLRGLSDELQGVQKIMFENIDAVLQRGELITGEHFSNNLVPVPYLQLTDYQPIVSSTITLFPVAFSPAISDKALRLKDSSWMYRKEARYLNLRSSLAAKAAIAVVVFLFLIFLRYWLF